MNELDDFSAPASTAPSATKPASLLDDFSLPVSTAQQKASVFSNSNPDEAGKAVSLSKQTGIPASIVQTDIPGYDAHAKTQAAIQAVKNPAIASYIDNNQMASQVSNDDYPTLDKISGMFSRLSKEAIDHATTLNLADQTPLGDMASTEPGREKIRGYAERMRAGFAGGFGEGNEVERILNEARGLGLSEQTIKTWEFSGLLSAARAVEGAIRLVPGLIGGAFGAASGLVAEQSGSEAWADRLLREAPGANAALMGLGATSAHPKFGPTDPVARVLASQDDLHQFVAEHTLGGPRAKSLSAGETPEDQLWQTSKPEKSLDERLDDFADERAALATEEYNGKPNAKIPEDKAELNQALSTASLPGWNHERAMEAIKWSVENDRPDIAQAIVERAQRSAEQTGLIPGVAKDNPKYAKIEADLARSKQQYLNEAAQLREAAGLLELKPEFNAKVVIDQAKAESAGDALDEAVAASQESKTKERSPELYEKYLEAHGDQGTVHVPAQAILDLYKREGKIPLDGDGLFGFVPGLAEKATLAAETGAEIKIPLSKYIAHVDEAVHEGLKDQVRVQENGVTREEAKLAKEENIVEGFHGSQEVIANFDPEQTRLGRGVFFAEKPELASKFAEGRAVDSDPLYIYGEDTPQNINKFVKEFAGDVEAERIQKLINQAEAVTDKDNSQEFSDLSNKINDELRIVSSMSDEFGGGSPNVTRAKINLGKSYEFDMGGKFSWEKEADAIKYALENGFDSVTFKNVGEDGKFYTIFKKDQIKIPYENQVVQTTVERAIANEASLGISKPAPFLSSILEDGKAAGITEAEFKRYSDLIDRGQEAVLTKAVTLAKREAAKRLTPEWRANEDRVRGEVESELTRTPTYLADRYFNFDKGMLPNGKRILSDFFEPMDQVKADEWAPIFGFESGSEMSTAVLAREGARQEAGKGPKWQLKQEVEAETGARMEAQYGKLADNIALEASEAALAEHNVDLLATEVKMLAKLNGREPPLNREELTSWVKDQFDKSTASDVSYEQWRRASEKGGREAEKALLKKDYEEAFLTKQRQMLAFMLAREAKAFEKEVGRAEKLFDKYASEVNLSAVEQAYTDQIHRLMQQYGLDTKRTQENTDYNLQGVDKDFANFVRDRNANGAMIVQADLPAPRAGANARPIDSLTVDQYRDFAIMIKSLDHNGRTAKQIELAGKREAYNEVIDKVAKNLDTLEKDDFDPDAKGIVSGLRKLGRAVDSRLLKAEKLMDWIDKKDPLGAMNSAVLRGLIEGEQAKGDMITRLAGMAKDLPGDRAWGKALDDLTNNKELLDWETGKPMKLTNENKIAIALNYGNKSNRRVMLEGYHWTEPEVEAFLKRELTPMDKAMVDGLHGLFEPLAPLVEKATSSRSGVAIPLIEGTPFEGMKGGYYPLVEDPRAKLLGQQVSTDLFQKTKFDPLPTANALKQRTGKVYPVDLTINQIHSRLSQTAHAVFMQDPVINANKVISDPIVREGVAKAFGPEYVTMLDKWIRDIADNGGSDVGFRDDAAVWLSRNLRQNVTVQLMGWKASTALIHGGSAAASSVYEDFKLHMPTENAAKSMVLAPARLVQNMRDLGLGQFLPQAAQRFFGSQSNMFDAINFVMDNSGEMRNRQRSLQKDFGYQLDQITNSSLIDDAAKARAVHQTYSMAMVAYLDQLTATPVWKAAYDHALVEKGMEHDDAVYVADKAVREAHGSASLVSRANIGRGEINKWLTIAYNGYWNHNYNKMREAGKEIGGYDDSLSNLQRVAVGAAFITAMIVAPALVHHAVRGEEAKTTGGAIANMMVSQFGGTVPLVNTLTYSMMHNRDPSISPLDEVLKSASNIVRDQMAANPKHTARHAAQAFGYLTGLPPTNQAIDTFTFMNDVTQRRQDPKSVQEWARGVMTGSSQPKAHR